MGALAGVAALWAAPLASATSSLIVPGRSIGPVALGQERATIGLRYGAGVVLKRTPNPDLPGSPNTDIVLVRYPALAISARFPTDEASSAASRVITGWDRYRTSRGIGVGSSRGDVRRAHPGAVCLPRLCRLGRPGPGRAITRFHLVRDRVTLVEVLRAG
jgi:hypothetical protein